MKNSSLRKLFRLSSVAFILMTLAVVSCTSNQDPEVLEFGKDSCQHCKMLLMDHRFGAEILTKTGKTYKFDTLECMRDFIVASKNSLVTPLRFFVIDSQDDKKMLEAQTATYLIDPTIHSPMGAGIFASTNPEKLALTIKKPMTSIEVNTWNQVKEKIKWKD